jgi:hypothetical protein
MVAAFGVLQVCIPWVRAVFGELHYELILAALWENAAEPATFGERQPPYYPIGEPLPPTPPQPSILGVDKTQAPVWEVEVSVQSLVTDVEALLSEEGLRGNGADFALVRLSDGSLTFKHLHLQAPILLLSTGNYHTAPFLLWYAVHTCISPYLFGKEMH